MNSERLRKIDQLLVELDQERETLVAERESLLKASQLPNANIEKQIATNENKKEESVASVESPQYMYLMGNTTSLDFSDDTTTYKQVMQAWKEFENNSKLQSFAKWKRGYSSSYSYYHSFSKDFMRGQLTIGYKVDDPLNKKSAAKIALTDKTPYSVNIKDGSIDPSAWEAAYPSGTILKKFVFDQEGNTVDANGWLIKP